MYWKGGMLTKSQGPVMMGLRFGEVFLFDERRQEKHKENVFRLNFVQVAIKAFSLSNF